MPELAIAIKDFPPDLQGRGVASNGTRILYSSHFIAGLRVVRLTFGGITLCFRIETTFESEARKAVISVCLLQHVVSLFLNCV